MHRLWILLLCSLLLAAPAVAAAEQSTEKWRGFEQLMSEDEFRAAGLDKLSPEELSSLNRWLLHFLAHDSQQVVRTDAAVREAQQAPVRRRIAGPFRGWSGETVFTLDNGEVWKQRLPGRYAVTLDSPEVEIYRNFLGFFELRVLKTGKKIGVTRVK
jgi:hypothetical protein